MEDKMAAGTFGELPDQQFHHIPEQIRFADVTGNFQLLQ